MEPRSIISIIKDIVTAAARRTPTRSAKTTHMLAPQTDVVAVIVELLDHHRVPKAGAVGRVVFTVGAVAGRPSVVAIIAVGVLYKDAV